MKQSINKIIIVLRNNPQAIKTVCCFVFIVFVLLTNAHADTLTDPNGVDPDAAPIDGGLSLLVAAGVGYGAKKMKERRQQAEK